MRPEAGPRLRSGKRKPVSGRHAGGGACAAPIDPKLPVKPIGDIIKELMEVGKTCYNPNPMVAHIQSVTGWWKWFKQ